MLTVFNPIEKTGDDSHRPVHYSNTYKILFYGVSAISYD